MLATLLPPWRLSEQLLTAIRLQKAGISFVIYERLHDAGGTWLVNTHPGCGYDVESHTYSLSFELNSDWTRNFSGQQEILQYFRSVWHKYGLQEHVRFGHSLCSACFDGSQWQLTFNTQGEDSRTSVVCGHRFLVTACGQLSDPFIPAELDKSRALDTQGHSFHTAQWDYSVDLTQKKVVCIGTGASAVQIVPSIVKKVRELVIVQSTPEWILPQIDFPFSGIFFTFRSYLTKRRTSRGIIGCAQDSFSGTCSHSSERRRGGCSQLGASDSRWRDVLQKSSYQLRVDFSLVAEECRDRSWQRCPLLFGRHRGQSEERTGGGGAGGCCDSGDRLPYTAVCAERGNEESTRRGAACRRDRRQPQAYPGLPEPLPAGQPEHQLQPRVDPLDARGADAQRAGVHRCDAGVEDGGGASAGRSVLAVPAPTGG
eukprot:430750-Rhodomonas_salina.4